MKKYVGLIYPVYLILLFFALILLPGVLPSCTQQSSEEVVTKQMEPAKAAEMARSVEALVKPELADSLTISLWGVDSLVISPIAIDIDDYGTLYYATTNRQKNSEFDIRGHPEWEIASISLQTIDDKRAFLRSELSPENSGRNKWLKDLNGDSSHDWRDLTIEKENIYALKDLNGDGVADQTRLLVNDFHDEVTDVAGGLLKEGNDLFVAVGPDLWRMIDKNGDGIPDEKKSISHGYGIHIGFGGHGMSGVEMGPDGRIYWQIGDIGFNGTGPDGTKWEYPNSGVIARSNPDGSDFEIFASGLRNTHEFVFDEYGNLISEDNDGDHAGESERLVYIVNGSDAGWRSNWQYGKYKDPLNNTYKVWMDEKLWTPEWDGQAAYITPCIANYVNGPAGMVYNPGTALGPAYKNTFFIAEFVGNPAKSGVHAFKLKPKGASFELAETKMVLGGVLPTGLDFGPDGALYVADWIDGWSTMSYGRIWKMDDKNGVGSQERKQTQELLAADFSQRPEKEIAGMLRNGDMRVRLKAQFELVKRGSKGGELLRQALAQTSHQLARVHAIWGLSQLARQDKSYAAMLIPVLKDGDPEIRAQVAKWLGDIRYKEAGDALISLLKDTYVRSRFFAAEALGRIAHEPAIQPILDMLLENDNKDAYLRHAGSLALARIGKRQPLLDLAKHSSRSLRIAAVVALRRMKDPGITVFLQDRDEYIVTEAARAINDDYSIPDALPALGELLNTTSFSNEALIRRAINANLRLGTEKGLQNLVAYARKEGNPSVLRAEAIEAMSTWPQPSVLDRVDGRLRGEIKRDAAIARNQSGEALAQLLRSKDAMVRLSAVKAISRLDIRQANVTLLALLKTDPDAAVRVESLKALAAMQDQQISDAIKAAIADKDKSVRVAGISLLTKMNIPGELMVGLLADVIRNRTTEEKQASLLTLGKLPLENTGNLFSELLQQMKSGKLPPDVFLELEEAIDSSGSKDLAAEFKRISEGLSPDAALAAYAGSLNGGDPVRGRRVFLRHESAQCIRCHSYDDMGGNAGPRLNGVAARITRPQILEALINPSARLAPGFGVVTAILKDGKTVSGILAGENEKTITLKTGESQDQVIEKSAIEKRINAASSMPDMKSILTKKQIRDVVSFLAGLKEE